MNTETDPLDSQLLKQKGLTKRDFEEYHKILEAGYPLISLANSCKRGEEIKAFDTDEKKDLREWYNSETEIKILKFVPASGAASRMFKSLFNALESKNYDAINKKFFNVLGEFAFAEELLKRLNIKLKKDYSNHEKHAILETLLLPKGMDYGALPKGIIKFHKYKDGHTRTAFEEHFHEGAMYARTGDTCNIHFTVPAENVDLVKEHLESLSNCLKHEYNINFKIDTSIQKSSTDTPAIYNDNSAWVRTEKDEYLFRPAGHGALLENLNDLDADIIFIKNIDNVVPDRFKSLTIEYKELLAGVLLKVQKKVFGFLRDLEGGKLNKVDCAKFIEEWFSYSITGLDKNEIKSLLNRPLRVCGMVKNEGEPGGGPFIVNDDKSKTSLQIVESAQIDMENSRQAKIAKMATHFNPVDLVVGIKDYRGKKFNLLDFRNLKTGMVVSKNYMGRNIKALELPGLWNGSMHYWNTVFVEVPIETFNPVKTVFDLRRGAHQGMS